MKTISKTFLFLGLVAIVLTSSLVGNVAVQAKDAQVLANSSIFFDKCIVVYMGSCVKYASLGNKGDSKRGWGGFDGYGIQPIDAKSYIITVTDTNVAWNDYGVIKSLLASNFTLYYTNSSVTENDTLDNFLPNFAVAINSPGKPITVHVRY